MLDVMRELFLHIDCEEKILAWLQILSERRLHIFAIKETESQFVQHSKSVFINM